MVLRKIEVTNHLFLRVILTSKNEKNIWIFSFKGKFYILMFQVHVIDKKF